MSTDDPLDLQPLSRDKLTLCSERRLRELLEKEAQMGKLEKVVKAAKIVSEFGIVGEHDPNAMDYLRILLAELEQP